ncbi:hypothetical protein MLD38_002452 [Melastoma candidum]|uniref:Uncharacterized protein n=1 Tax=Melastoma candidum TaxID=119954 RepID=A0ACB9RZZ1_9MYRT|nr:hypothetical protein MLD38_002452 [Melastoma candidum]
MMRRGVQQLQSHPSSSPMSLSLPDCFSDLLCDEGSGTILTDDSPGCSSDLDYSSPSSPPAFLPDDGLRLAELLRGETDFIPSCGPHPQSVTPAREESVAWILKAHALYKFRPLTAYLSVNYMDRFLHSRSLPQSEGWPMQLLSVACLSLAAKMEEPLVPSLLDIQVEGAKHVFEPRTIRRMELLVLAALDWRLRSITPLCFLSFFAFKVDPTGTFVGYLVSHATELILSNIQEISFLGYRPSSIAAAALQWAVNTIPSLSLTNPGDAESWCSGLVKEEIVDCYRLTEELVQKRNKRKAPKVLPQFRVNPRASTRYGDSSSSSCSSSSSSDPCNKRRKPNLCLWVDEKEKGNSSEYEHEEKE